jgi:hypothetical protein
VGKKKGHRAENPSRAARIHAGKVNAPFKHSTMDTFLKSFLEPLSCLIYCITLGREYKLHHLKREGVLCIYYFAATIILSYASYLGINYLDNNWLYTINYLLSAFVFAYYFTSILSKQNNKIIICSVFGITILTFLYTTIVAPKSYFNSMGAAGFFLATVVSSFLFYRELLSRPSEKNILLNFDVWLISGFVLYFLGSFFIILTYDYFSTRFNYQQELILGNLWAVQNCLFFVASLITLSSQIWIAHRNNRIGYNTIEENHYKK